MDLRVSHFEMSENKDERQYEVFRTFNDEISRLSETEIKYLRALLWFGRGDFPTFKEAKFESDVMIVDENIGLYLIGKPLDKYLRVGLARLEQHPENSTPEGEDPASE